MCQQCRICDCAAKRGIQQMLWSQILKNFSFMIDQNKGNPEGTEHWLRAIVEHMYEEHNHCNISWCGFLKDRKYYQHNILPHGKDLASSSLLRTLERV